MIAYLKEAYTREIYIDAEEARKKGDFKESLKLFKIIQKKYPEKDFLIQRIALVTYKSPCSNSLQSLFDAEEILSSLKPYNSNVLETLGLCGAVNKRLFEELGKNAYFEKSLLFYKRGFSLYKDYYTGINVAYLYALKALQQNDIFNAFADYGIANSIWKKVIQNCEGLISDKTFPQREDKEWIYQSLSQAYLGTEKMDKVMSLLPLIREHSKGHFDLDTFRMQNAKLIRAIDGFKTKFLHAADV
jgi:hypothetical protein